MRLAHILVRLFGLTVLRYDLSDQPHRLSTEPIVCACSIPHNGDLVSPSMIFYGFYFILSGFCTVFSFNIITILIIIIILMII